MGNPQPFFCLGCCGYSFWFSGVSAVVALLPSTILTFLPRHLNFPSACDSSESLTCLNTHPSFSSDSLCLPWQYADVDGLGGPASPFPQNHPSAFSTAQAQDSAFRICHRKTKKVFSGLKSLLLAGLPLIISGMAFRQFPKKTI